MHPRSSIFGFSKDIDAIAAAGYDCIEMHMREIMAMDEIEFEALHQKLLDSNLCCEVLDNPVPLDQVVANPEFDIEYYHQYLEKGAQRAEKMQVKFYVFGNGRTRSLPLEGDIEAARSKNLLFMRMLADIAGSHGINVLIEPLAPTVSNFIYSIPEAIAYAKIVDRPNLGTFLDYRWFVDRNHPFSMVEEYGQDIKHVHVDNPDLPFPKRLVPKVNDGHDYSGLFRSLKKIDYQGIISIEANTFDNFVQDLREGLAFLAHYATVESYS